MWQIRYEILVVSSERLQDVRSEQSDDHAKGVTVRRKTIEKGEERNEMTSKLAN